MTFPSSGAFLDVPAADGAGSYAWNTTGVAPGTYYLSGYLWDATAGQPVYSELYTTPIVIVASVATTSVQPTTRYTYDANGNLISTTDPDQHTSWTQYDSLNRVVGQTTADGSGPGANGYTTVTVYDADGNVLSVTDPDGNETSYTYDADGNVVSVIDTGATYVAGGVTVTSPAEPGVTYWYTYDADGRLQTELMAPGDLPQSSTYVQSPKAATFTPLTSLTYTYDADGNLKQVDDGMGQRTIYDYNALDELTGAEQGTVSGGVYTQARSASFTYDPDGNLLTITRYTTGITTPDVVSTYGYDATGQITSLARTHTQSANDVIILANYTWTYDAAGNSTSQTLTTADTMTMGSSGLLQGPVVDDSSTYSYDAADQLTGDSLNGGSYSYDGNGNRTSDTITSGNRMASDGTYNYTYDANGNCVSRTTISSGSSSQYITLYTWDYRNRLVEVQYETSAGQLTETINYSYDYLNRRIKKITFPSGGAADHSYLAYQGNQPYAQFDSGTAAITATAAAGDETDWYMQAATVDQVLSDYQPDSYGETLWLLPDNQGTIRDLAADMNFGTQSTFVIIHRNFDAFGNITSVQCNVTFPFTITTAIGYCGGIYDPDLRRSIKSASLLKGMAKATIFGTTTTESFFSVAIPTPIFAETFCGATTAASVRCPWSWLAAMGLTTGSSPPGINLIPSISRFIPRRSWDHRWSNATSLFHGSCSRKSVAKFSRLLLP